MQKIRTATFEDLDAIAAVEAACFPAAEAATKEEFAGRLTHYADHFWLLFEDEKLVSFVDGFVTDTPDLTDEMYADASLHDAHGAWQMIFGVNTLPEYRKQGLAGQLLRRAIADAKAQGRRGLVLTCKDRLVHYYAGFGFVSEGVSVALNAGLWYNTLIIIGKVSQNESFGHRPGLRHCGLGRFGLCGQPVCTGGFRGRVHRCRGAV